MGEPGRFYHICDVKGRHDLITQGWTKLGAHACSNTSVFNNDARAYNTTTHKISCHSACHWHQVPNLMLLESTTPVYLAIYGCCSQWFLCYRCYACTCLDHELKLCGRDSVHAHAQLSRVYLASTLDVTHVIKCTRLSPTLTRRAWERG